MAWRRGKNGFVGQFTKDWSEEGLPTEVVAAAEQNNIRVCNEMKR